MKQCIRCKETKELSKFHKHKGMKDGRLNKCAKCVKECVDEWRKNNPESRNLVIRLDSQMSIGMQQ